MIELLAVEEIMNFFRPRETLEEAQEAMIQEVHGLDS